ncbi:hypothetical protein QEN19_004273 [Hanseniaspora menglaensis]
MSSRKERLQQLVSRTKKNVIDDDEDFDVSDNSVSFIEDVHNDEDKNFVEDDEGDEAYTKEEKYKENFYKEEDAKFEKKKNTSNIKNDVEVKNKKPSAAKLQALKAKENSFSNKTMATGAVSKVDINDLLDDYATRDDSNVIGSKRHLESDDDKNNELNSNKKLRFSSQPQVVKIDTDFAPQSVQHVTFSNQYDTEANQSDQEIKSILKTINSKTNVVKNDQDEDGDAVFTTKIAVSDNDSSKGINSNLYSDDGTFNYFYYMDYLEENNKLYLFGKIKLKDSTYKSCMIQINNMCKELYFLPKDGVTVQDLAEKSFDNIVSHFGVETLRTKNIKKKYAFELKGIPRGKTQYFKVFVPFDCKKNGNNGRALNLQSLTGGLAKIVFGNFTKPFESFTLQKQVMGPSWLKIKNLRQGDANKTHCSLSFEIDNLDEQLFVDVNNLEVPLFKSMALKTQQLLTVAQKQELVTISFSIDNDFKLISSNDNKTNTNKTVTLVRLLDDTSCFTPIFKKKLNEKYENEFRFFNDEKTMLTAFMNMVKLCDPDFLLGHRLEQVELDILINRLITLNIKNFSNIGRFQRNDFPNYFYGQSKYKNSLITGGRMIVDIGNELGISLTSKCDTWDLNEMYNLYSGKADKVTQLEVNMQSLQHSESETLWEQALLSSRADIDLIICLVENLQIIPLSLQLTNLAGNGWKQTLQGSRAIRNEFILLHEFTKLKYIVPDPYMRQQQSSNTNNKKSTFQGGLVFEPEKGLHKNFTLVMDFNSLYPSIIQEFNICFTTVERDQFLTTLDSSDDKKDEEEAEEVLPEYPSKQDQQMGVLPKLLNTLVERRKAVKGLMATTTDQSKKNQYDIKQQALKLTANSMYGCLGFKQSRFYAKPLAMMITNKGREILQHTRQLAENNANLQVVYGDTDSVMINSRCNNYNDAIKIGESFKQLVNKQYGSLEIDIDNVFQRLLLTAKKKYAALNCYWDKGANKLATKLEVKGLDMKRREYCPLTKKTSEDVLNLLLSELDEEDSLNKIYDYLEDVSTNLLEHKISVDQFKINTKLGKDPEDYGNAGNNMPAVQAAMRLKKDGRQVKQGAVITFVIVDTEPSDATTDKSSTISVAARAIPLRELMRKRGKYKIDSDFYLEKQLMNPIKRLLENIEGFEIQRFAESLQIKNQKFAGGSNSRSNFYSTGFDVNNSQSMQTLESLMGDSERFSNCENLTINCSNCGHFFAYHGIVRSPDYKVTNHGIKCMPCQTLISTISVLSQLEVRTRAQITKFYETPYECDDSSCDCKTYGLGVYGKKCLNNDCYGGTLTKKNFNDKQLYNQLSYFQSLFDFEKNKKQNLKVLDTVEEDMTTVNPYLLDKSESRRLAESLKEGLLGKGFDIMESYLELNGRRYVDLSSIFG